MHTAASLAAQLEVSERTLYRDVRDLVQSGVPIEGEAGVGYVMNKGFDLPPLMFTESELEALALGARMVEAYADEGLARRARDLLSKIKSVLPAKLQARLDSVSLFVPDFRLSLEMRANLGPLRAGIAERRRLRFRYARGDGQQSQRVVHPLGLFFWGQTWTLVAWCELRDDYRNFRPDRMSELELLEERFEADPERGLESWMARMRGFL